MTIFTLEKNEAIFIVQIIGQLPTSSGAFPLLKKLEEQIQKQIKEQITE